MVETAPTAADATTVDFDAIDAEVAKGKAADGKTEPEAVEIVHAEPAPKGETKPVLTADAGVEKLKRQLESEREARIDAERRASEAASAEVAAKTEVHDTQLDLLTHSIASLTQANDALEEKYATALANQDYQAAAKTQREMATNAAKLLQLEQGKAGLEKAPKPTARVSNDPVDRFVARLSPRSAEWVRSHPEYVRDERKNAEMIAAHNLAMARGVKPDTDEYFGAIEKILDLADQTSAHAGDADPTADAARPVRSAPPAAAPVSRSGNGTGVRQNRVTLSADQVEMAHLMFPDSKNPEQEYAKNMLLLKKEGKLN